MPAQAISFSTFNLLNLNEPDRPMYADDDVWTEAQVRDKVAWTASMLRRIEADVIGVQELWDRGPLDRACALSGLHATHDLCVSPGLDGSRITCAALVRKGLLLEHPEWIDRFPDACRIESRGEDPQTPAIRVALDAFSRPVLHMKLRFSEALPPVHAFVCHFKSRGPTRLNREPWFRDDPSLHKPHAAALGAAVSTVRRTAEATALRVILTQLMKATDEPVVVLGDLNDGPDTSTLNILTEQPTFVASTASGGSDTALYSVQSLQELESLKDVYFTYIYKRVHGSLDHILVSREFYNQNRRRLWTFKGIDVFNDHLPGEEAVGANDHGLVRARFAAGKR